MPWAVLGGGGEWRELHPGVIDMERIDPDAVTLPAWYTPNPHRSSDVAFVLFTGEGQGTKALQITNRRWALSALGTASAAALRAGDTVFSTTPMHHSSALLMSVGGAVASGARFALASADDPDTFWEEVRRYGATHVSYTWASLDDVSTRRRTRASSTTRSGCSSARACRATSGGGSTARFPGTKVLEFYASAEGETILANVSGRNAGSMGRPLPGTAEVRVAAFDLTPRRLRLGSDGLARECGAGRGRSAAQPRRPGRAERRRAAARRVRAGRRLALDAATCSCATTRATCGSPVRSSEIVDTADGPALPVRRPLRARRRSRPST